MTQDSESLRALETARARLQERTERSRTAAAEAARMADDLRALTASAASPRREVTVVARPDGTVDRVDLTDAALGLDAAALSRLVTDTVRRAQQDAAAAALSRMSDTLGADSPLVAEVRAQVAARHPRASELG